MEKEFLKKNWVLKGLLWGSFMFLTLAIVMPLLEGVHLVPRVVIIKLVVWLLMGLAYGYTMHHIERKKEN